MVHPRQGKLTHSDAFAVGNTLQTVNKSQVLRDVLIIGTREVIASSDVVRIQNIGRPDASGEKASTERGVCENLDAQFTTGGSDFSLDVSRP